MYDYLLFDLDGTLTDPKEGITKSVQYALETFGITEPDLDKLTPFIGPPLMDSFMDFYGFSKEQAAEGVERYRANFKDQGIFQNKVYPGIPEMLGKLKKEGKKLAVASSKPTVFVERILEHFSLRQYFTVVVGSELDGTRATKSEVVEEALRQLLGDNYWEKIQKDAVAIVGDRRFDVEGGQAFGLTTVAVSYGYGPMEELKEAKADYIVRTVEELEKLLLRGTQDAKYEPAFNKMWAILFPVLIGFFVWQIGGYVGMYVTASLGNYVPALSPYLVEMDDQGGLLAMTGIGMVLMSLVSFLIVGITVFRMGRPDLAEVSQKAKERGSSLGNSPKMCGSILVASVFVSLGLNIFLDLIGLTNKTEAYNQLQEQVYAAPLWMAILVYCIVAPVAEEILFRGILYHRMKKYLNVFSAMFLSSALFGLYHGNIISGVYAFLMGMLIALVYEKTGHFGGAVAAHVLINVCAYTLTYTGVFDGLLLNWPMCTIFLFVGVIGIWQIYKQELS